MPQILFSPRLVANGASYVRFFILGTDFGRFTISSFWCREFIFPLELPIRSRRKTKFKIFFTDLGALALSRALVGIGERALENECHRFDFHPDWSPTERAMFESFVLGTDFGRFTISSFLGGREFSFPWRVVGTSVGHRTNGRLPY